MAKRTRTTRKTRRTAPPRKVAPPRRAAPRAIESALAGFAHEIRTPLTGIIAIGELLSTSELGERERRWVAALKEAAEHIVALTTAVVETAKAGSSGLALRRERFDALALAQSLAASCAARAQAKGLGCKTAIVSGNATALSSSKATWKLDVPTTSTINISIANSSGQTVYTGNFSANAGTTDLGNFNLANSGADLGDWNISMANDPFGYGIAGVTQLMSGNDVAVMAAIGWNMTSQCVTAAQAAAAYNVA